MTPPASAAAAPAVHPRRPATPGRRSAPPRPRRVSGPARRGIESPAPRRADAERGLALSVLERLGSLSRVGLLDRLLRGRTWIALVAFALIGIVTLQLALLKLNASIGRTLEKGAVLQRENASLSIENSELSAGDRVESRAARLGMELLPTGALRFLSIHPGSDARHGAAALSTPLQSASPGAGAEGPSTSASAPASSGASSSSSEGTSSQGPSPATESSSASGAEASASASTGESASASSSSSAPSASTPAAGEPSSSAPAAQVSSQPEAPSESSAEGSPAGGTQAGPTG